jgi:hypothetical protein
LIQFLFVFLSTSTLLFVLLSTFFFSYSTLLPLHTPTALA